MCIRDRGRRDGVVGGIAVRNLPGAEPDPRDVHAVRQGEVLAQCVHWSSLGWDHAVTARLGSGERAELEGCEELVGLALVVVPVSYTHLRAHETKANLVCRLLLEK